MKNIFTALVIIALFASLGCSDYFQQDPLKGKGKEVENGEEPDRKPDIAEPVDSDSLKIDGPSEISFREEEESIFQFGLRVLEEDYPLDQVEIVVKNLDEFPGASFDSQTLEFKWKPEKGTVPNLILKKSLELVAIAHPIKEKKVILRNSKTLPLSIEKKIDAPQIKSVTFNEKLIREGDTAVVRVEVYDPEGGTLSDDAPKLIFGNRGSWTSLAPFIVQTGVDINAVKKTWTFNLKINLYEAELTKSVTSAAVSFVAVNRYGRTSQPSTIDTLVATSFGFLDSTWSQDQVVQEGEKNIVNFVVFDTRSEAKLSFKKPQDLPKGAKLKCADDTKYYMRCNFEWVPTAEAANRRFTLFLDAEFSNLDYRDDLKLTKTVKLPLRVLPAPTPTPTPPPPTPAPTPTPEPTPNPTPIEET